ncbi:MAG: hypothetical protein ACE5F5_07635 [Acidimicrobiia bacterium]
MGDRKRVGGVLVLALAVAALVLLPAAFLVWALNRPPELEGVTTTPEPLVVEVAVVTTSASQEAEMTLTWSAVESLVAPAWSGLVTEVFVGPGDVITSTGRVLNAGGLDRIAYHAPRPFYRPIRKGDSGPDVETLHQLLTDLGLVEGDALGDVASSKTVRAIGMLAAHLGGSAKTRVFDPGWVVWLPGPEFEVGELLVEPGQPAPPQGQPFAVSRQRIESAVISDVQVPPDLAGLDWVVDVGGTELPVEISNLLKLAASVLDELEKLVEPGFEEPIPVILRLAEPASRVVVPVSAVAVYESGDTCVWQPGPGGSTPVAVELGRTRGDVVEVVAGVELSSQVVANPAEAFDGGVCGPSP